MSFKVRVDVSSIYEFLNSFIIFSNPRWINNLDLGQDWLDESRSRLSLEEAEMFKDTALWKFSDFDILLSWVIQRKPKMRIPDFLDHLEFSDARQVHHEALELLPHLSHEEIEQVRERYTPLLRIWYKRYFKDVELEHEHYLREDVLEKKTLEDKMEPADLIEISTSGIRVGEHLPIDQVVLLPTLHLRPLNTYCFYHRLLVLQYPIDFPEKEGQPPNLLLRMTRALADPLRLNLLRFISEQGPLSFSEMKKQLPDLSDTLTHHLMLLRVAGLLLIHLDVNQVENQHETYSLRKDGIADLQIFLESYIRV
ncbi:ArsR/SmtB family transcription factor [Paenibacillus pinistramenti]|uniref:ArsR/SmtB family transcription factor n=1 Tax=Paenibacillus pinistramenti TaxID=1768003 RepID=UPI001109F69C|nr:helix-turn-helix domain-containing protein [Paenibacillus pinistramenti]